MTISNTRTQHTNTQTIEKIHDSAEFLTLDQLRNSCTYSTSDIVELVVKDSGNNPIWYYAKQQTEQLSTTVPSQC